MNRIGSEPAKYEIVLGALLATAFWLVVALLSGSSLTSTKELAGPLATVFAAMVAGWVAYKLGQSQVSVAKTQADIAYRNWQTSNEKIVLELFDKRLKLYEAIREVIAEVTRSGTARDDTLFRYDVAVDRAPYLFGREVQDYLHEIREHLIWLDTCNSMLSNLTVPDRAMWAERRTRHFTRVTGFYTHAPPLFQPYMQAHQKVA